LWPLRSRREHRVFGAFVILLYKISLRVLCVSVVNF